MLVNIFCALLKEATVYFKTQIKKIKWRKRTESLSKNDETYDGYYEILSYLNIDMFLHYIMQGSEIVNLRFLTGYYGTFLS